MIADPNLVFQGLGWGAIGGFTYHAYWLVSIGHAAGGTAISSAKRNRNFRLSLLGLSGLVGAVAGFLVFAWFLNELKAGAIPKEKVCVIAGLAGLSGESVLRTLRRLSGL